MQDGRNGLTDEGKGCSMMLIRLWKTLVKLRSHLANASSAGPFKHDYILYRGAYDPNRLFLVNTARLSQNCTRGQDVGDSLDGKIMH